MKSKLEKFYDSLEIGMCIWAISYAVQNTYRPKQYRDKHFPILVKTKLVNKSYNKYKKELSLCLDKIFWFSDKYSLDTVFINEAQAIKKYLKLLEIISAEQLIELNNTSSAYNRYVAKLNKLEKS